MPPTPSQRFEALLRDHRRIVMHVARLYAPHPDDRQELAQEIIAQLWRAFARYDETRRFSTWMYRIALNVGISFLRDASRRGHVMRPLDDMAAEVAVPPADDGDRMEALYHLIATLDPMNRAMILLYLDDRPYAEIGEILGLSDSNVATKMQRIKQKLRDQALRAP